MPRSYVIGEFAEELGVHPETVKRWCRNGDLDHTRTPGGDQRIPHRELLRLAGDARPRDQVALYARVSSPVSYPQIKSLPRSMNSAENTDIYRRNALMKRFCRSRLSAFSNSQPPISPPESLLISIYRVQIRSDSV